MATVTRFCPSCGEQVTLDDSREFGFCCFCGGRIQIQKEEAIEPAEHEEGNQEGEQDIAAILESAKAGDRNAQIELVPLYLYGRKVERDYIEAQRWLDIYEKGIVIGQGLAEKHQARVEAAKVKRFQGYINYYRKHFKK